MKAFFKLKRESSVLGRWFLSYMFVLLIILALIIMTENIYTDIIVDEIVEKKYIEIESFKNSMDEITDECRYFTLNLSENSTIKDITTRGFSTEKNRYELREALLDISAHMTEVDEFFIYLKNENLLINSNGYIESPERLFNAYYKTPETEYDKWKNKVLDLKNAGYYALKTKAEGQSRELVQIYYSLPLENITGNNITLISVIDTQKYAKEISKLEKNGEVSLLTYDETGTVFFEFGRYLPNAKQMELAEKTETFFESKVGKDEVVFCKVLSDVTGWRYLFSMSKDMFWSRLFLVNFISIIAIILILILGVAGIYVAVRRNYREVSKIVARIETEIESSDIDSKDEFQIIDNVLDVAAKLKNELAIKEERLRNEKICNLLLGIGDEGLKTKLYCECKQLFDSESFMTVIFNLNVYESLFEDEDISKEERRKCMAFIVDNIIKEMLVPFGSVDTVESNNIIFLFSPSPLYIQNAENIVYDKMREAVTFIKEKFNISLECGISNLKTGLSNICVSYDEAKAALKFGLEGKSDNLYLYSENVDKKSYISQEQENLLILKLKKGDFADVARCIDGLVTEFQRDNPASETGVLLAEMMGIIFEAAMNVGYKFIDEKYVDISSGSVAEITIDTILEMSAQLCRYQNIGDGSSDEKIVKQVNDIIEIHYTDVNLNVAMIAKVLDMNMNYLSGLYKRKTNMNILSKIQQRRLQAAIVLLHKEDYSIEKVSNETGFGSTVTFNRVFKKYIGMTPGKYRATKL